MTAPGRVGGRRLLVVAVVGGRHGAGGVPAGRVGGHLGGQVAVGVVGAGDLPGVGRAGDPVGDRRVSLLGHPAVGVVGVGRDQRVGVGDDLLLDLPADPVVAVEGFQAHGADRLGDVAVPVVQRLGDRAGRADGLPQQPGRRHAAVGAARGGPPVGVGVGGGAAVGPPRHRRGDLGQQLARGGVIGVRGQVGAVGRGGRAPVTEALHQVVAGVRRAQLSRLVVGRVAGVGGRAAWPRPGPGR